MPRCSLRLFPHHQNTGGFFVCVIEKSQDQPNESVPESVPQISVPPLENVLVADEAGPSSAKRAGSPSVVETGQPDGKRVKGEAESSKSTAPQRKPKRDLSFREEPFSYVNGDREEIKSIM